MGRPAKEIDWDMLEKLAQFPMKQEDLAWLVGVCLDTLCTKVKEKYDMSFSDFLAKKGAKTKALLYEKQIELALKGNVTLLIWLGKQYLGQSDKQEVKAEHVVSEGKLIINLNEGEKLND